jgi:hypothetical protein
VKQYQLGVDYTNSYDGVAMHYETDGTGGEAAGCAALEETPDRRRCIVPMAGGGSSGWGLFLQQAFRSQGFWYFKPDVGFGARYLTGGLSDRQRQEQQDAGLPLRDVDFELLTLVVKPYVQLGVTPQRWPDLLVSLGPAVQVAAGNVTVNDERERVAMATASESLLFGFYELELVFARFGDGAFSVFTSSEVSSGSEGTKFYPHEKDGMDDIRADFHHNVSGGVMGFGAKLVLDWP